MTCLESDMITTKRTVLTKLLTFLLGVYIGITLSNLFRKSYVERKQCLPGRIMGNSTKYRPRVLSEELDTKELLFVGVMTTERFLESRATAVYHTWGKLIPGKLVFFSGEKSGNTTEQDLPVVRLSGVDDSYPPRRKSLMMLKYIYHKYINQFKYYMRCDDDLYIRTDQLETFLRGFDSAQDLFIGQAGVGSKEDQGRLGLGPTDNFCMGGTGVIMSRGVLKKVGPHLDHCLKNVVSPHEDVEVGRCIRKHVGVSCTWAFEMQWLFYHNQSKINAFHKDLETNAVLNAITMHPMKDSKYIYRIHHHFQEKKIQTLHRQSVTKSNFLRRLNDELKKNKRDARQVSKLNEKGDLHGTVPRNSTLHWEVFDPQLLFSTTRGNVKIKDSLRKSLNIILRTSLFLINEGSQKSLFRKLLLSKVNLGYMRVSPTCGAQYILDLRMTTFQHIGYSRRKMPLNVHYQAHVQQFFGNLVYTSTIVHETHTTIHIILPLAGRLQTFATFLTNFEKVVLVKGKTNVKLLILYFPDVAPSENHKQLTQIYQENYPNFDVTWKNVPGPFSRGLALQLGSVHFGAGALLFFCDVDLIFDDEFLQRCQHNTKKGRRVYYPIVFSQFNQSFWKYDKSHPRMHTKDKGFWRHYGFGMICVYSGDVEMVGGFDTKIRGWGLEDVKLYERFISAKRYEIFRVPDPGLTHIHHKSACSNDLEPSRQKMCTSSKLGKIASAGSLVDHMQGKGYYEKRGDKM